MSGRPQTPTIGRRLLAVASVERGALMWIPALLAAVGVTLFAMRMAPRGGIFYPRTTSMRLAVAPCIARGTTAEDDATFVGALCRGLAAHGELSLMDSVSVARRLATLDARSADAGMEALLHAVEPLNPHLLLCSELERAGQLSGRISAWDVRDRRRVLDVAGAGSSALALGSALAESLSMRLLEPRRVIAALH